MAKKLPEPHCEIEDVDCMFYPQCVVIYQIAQSMTLNFRCPVVTGRDHR